MWHVVLRFSPYLSFKFREVFKDYRQSISGTTAEDPRWQDCLSVVDGSFGMPFGLLFVDETFEGESKKSVGNRYSVEFRSYAMGLMQLNNGFGGLINSGGVRRVLYPEGLNRQALLKTATATY